MRWTLVLALTLLAPLPGTAAPVEVQEADVQAFLQDDGGAYRMDHE